MLTRKLEEAAKQAIVYANAYTEKSSTIMDFNLLSITEQEQIKKTIHEMRMRGKSHENQINIKSSFENIDYDSFLRNFYSYVDGAIESKSGNCNELSILALEYICRNYPTIRAEMFKIENGDHVFLILGRNQNSKDKDPLTFGAEAFFCDPLLKDYYPAHQYLEKLKNYTQELIADKTVNHYEDFDASKHQLTKEEGVDSENINAPQHIKEIKIFMLVKLTFLQELTKRLLSFLQNTLSEANQASDIEKDYIKKSNCFLEKLDQANLLTKDILKNENQSSYGDIRTKLKNTLQQYISEFRTLLNTEISNPNQMKGAASVAKTGIFASEVDIDALEKINSTCQYISTLFKIISDHEYDTYSTTKLLRNSAIETNDNVNCRLIVNSHIDQAMYLLKLKLNNDNQFK